MQKQQMRPYLPCFPNHAPPESVSVQERHTCGYSRLYYSIRCDKIRSNYVICFYAER